jgi:hypothetical protein
MTSLKELIDAYEERFSSYQFLLKKIEIEMLNANDPKFIDFCECEGKRLQDLMQLCHQVLNDLNHLGESNSTDTNNVDGKLDSSKTKQNSESD